MAVALRLQVAVKVAQHDERTTVELRRDCSEAKINAAIANKRADEAAEIIQALKIEISSLKRKLRELQTADDELPDVNGASLHALASVEVDKLAFNSQNKVKFAPNTGGHPENATPFQQWKMQHFVWTPDTPAASALHDKQAVDMLADAVTSDTLRGLNRFQFPSHSSVGKLRKRLTADEDRVIVPKAVQKQTDAVSRLSSLPASRNPDRLCATTPDSMGGGIASPLPPFITSMNRRPEGGSPSKNKKGAPGRGGKAGSRARDAFEFDSEDGDAADLDQQPYRTTDDARKVIESAYRFSVEQQQGGPTSRSRPSSRSAGGAKVIV